MSTGWRFLTTLAAGFAVMVVGWVMLLGAVVAVGGVASVRIQNPDGPSFYVPIPAVLIDVAASSGGWLMTRPGGEALLEELEAEMELEHWGPVARDLLEVIEDCPDVTFVEVEDGRDRVRVFKEGRYLRVQVSDGRDFNLKVSLPVRTATRTVARLIG